MDIEKNEILEEQQPDELAKTPEMLLPKQYQPKPLFELQKFDKVFAVCALMMNFTSLWKAILILAIIAAGTIGNITRLVKKQSVTLLFS